MDLDSYLIEQKLKKDPDLLNFFNSFSSEVFDSGFLSKINKGIPDLKIKEVVNNNKNLAAYTRSRYTIYINRPVFYRLKGEEKISILMHEFIHILQFKRIPEINRLSTDLWNFVNRYKLPEVSVSEVVLGKKFIKSKFMNKNEILPYLMNQNFRWEKMKEGSKEELVNILQRSRIFNLSSDFWKKKLE